MNINELDLNLLVVFDALITEGTVTKAATRVGLSQPALSNALSRLRTLLNDPLFVRTPQGMQPTPRAKQLALPIRQALTLIQNSFQENTSFDFATEQRTFKLVMSDYCAHLFLPCLLEWFREVAPGIRLKVMHYLEKELQPMMESGNVDLAIGVFIGMEAGYYQQKLFEEDFTCIVRTDHPLIKSGLSKKQFLSLKHVLVSPRGTGLGRTDKILAERGEKRDIMLHVPHFLIVPTIIERTNLIATLPTRIAQSFAASGNIKTLKHPYKVPGFTLTQFWHEQNHNDAANQWLRQSVFRICQRF